MMVLMMTIEMGLIVIVLTNEDDDCNDNDNIGMHCSCSIRGHLVSTKYSHQYFQLDSPGEFHLQISTNQQ